MMEEAAWNCTVDQSPRNGAVIIGAAWRSERLKGAVGSAEGGLQIKGDAECVCFVRRNDSCEVEGLRECAGVRIEDPMVCKRLQPLYGVFNQYNAKE